MHCRFALFLLLFPTLLWSQEMTLPEIQDRSIRNAKHQFITLGSWAVGNMVVSGSLINRYDGSEKYFHQMNVIWNGVNLGIAALAYWDISRRNMSGLSLSETIEKQHQLERVLLFNAGLDLAYVAGGLYMHERGRNDGNNRLEGFGKSVILQGAFLFTYDMIFFFIQHRNAKELLRLVDGLSLGPTGFSLVIPINRS
jgi:hypothetical protein